VTCNSVKTQSELDAALTNDDVDCVHIESERGVWLEVCNHRKTVEVRGSASVRAFDSASVSAFDSASVSAFDSASVRAFDSASVRAFDSASVRAFGSASVRAFGSASVSAFDSASVSASGSASVRAFDSASVRAFGSASVRAFGSASVRAFGSASVRAFGSASVRAFDSASVRAFGSASVRAFGSASVRAFGSAKVDTRHRCKIQAGPHVAVHLHSAQASVIGGVVIDLTSLDLTDAQTWCDHEGVEVADDRAVLYKAVDSELTAGYGYQPYTYAVGADLVCADWIDSNDCGGGLHLSPTPEQATYYREDATRWLRCTADLADVRPILGDVAKCKVRALRVEAEVDARGRELATASA
jgi:hypothetical protein